MVMSERTRRLEQIRTRVAEATGSLRRHEIIRAFEKLEEAFPMIVEMHEESMEDDKVHDAMGH